MKIALVAAATQAVSRRKGVKQIGDRPGKTFCDLSVSTPLGAHGVQRPIWRDCWGHFSSLTALIPLPASVPAQCRFPRVASSDFSRLALCPGTAHYTRTRARAAWAGRRSPSSLFCRLLASAGIKTHHGGLSIGARTRRWLRALLFRCPDVRLAGEDVCTPPGLGSSAGARLLRHGEVCVSTRNLSLVWPEAQSVPARAFQSPQEDAPTLWPAGAFQKLSPHSLSCQREK